VPVRLSAAALVLILLADSLHASERVRRICIPNQDGSGWICGTEDDPPQAPAAPPARSEAPRAPPPFLADPQGTRTLPMIPLTRPTPRRPAAVEVQPVTETATTVETLTPPEPESAAPAAPPAPDRPQPSSEVVAPAAEPLPAPDTPPPAMLQPAPAVEPDASPEPVPAPEPLPSPEPEPEPQPLPEPEPAPAPAPEPRGQPEPAAAAATSTLALPAGPWRVEAALGAAPDQWTLQLAHGADAATLANLATTLALPGGALHLLPLERDGARWWLLTWGLFETPEQAREAGARLPASEGLRGVWPRRMEPLQNEIRRAQRIHSLR
jgi:septal ring-binding cell division protein DamX